jgi:hypothetical protein
MSFEAEAAPAVATVVESRAPITPRHDPVPFAAPQDPNAGWASRNPDRAMLFLFVTPRDCGAVEELMVL